MFVAIPAGMSRAFDFTLGEYLLHEMQEVFVIEDETQWAGAQAKRVADQLNQCRQGCQRLEPVVFWSEQVTAFTLPGPYVFISRELQQRLPNDAAVAFVLAHEMAHHDLRHFGEQLPTDGARALLTTAWRTLVSLAHRPEDEEAADRYALQLCLQAGYPRDECLKVFRILIAHSLDWGDIDGVFGAFDSSGSDEPSRLWRFRRWWWQRRRGYRCLVDRRDHLAHTVVNTATSDRATGRPTASPYRATVINLVKHCARCGREEVAGEETLCADCQRRQKTRQHIDHVIRKHRREELLENWKGIALVSALLLSLFVTRYVLAHLCY